MNRKRSLLLVGSPKNQNSTSYSIGNYILEHLSAEKYDKETICIYEAIKKEETAKSILEAVNNSDLIILSFPLYFDTLPAGAIKALEFIANSKTVTSPNKQQKLLIISNSGYPEKEQNDVALKTCEIFAKKCGMEIIGSFAVGSGTVINGKKLEEVGFLTKGLRKALMVIAEAISEGKKVPQDVMTKKTKLLLTNWGYVRLMHFMFLLFYKQNKVLGKVKRQPYQC